MNEETAQWGERTNERHSLGRGNGREMKNAETKSGEVQQNNKKLPK